MPVWPLTGIKKLPTLTHVFKRGNEIASEKSDFRKRLNFTGDTKVKRPNLSVYSHDKNPFQNIPLVLFSISANL